MTVASYTRDQGDSSSESEEQADNGDFLGSSEYPEYWNNIDSKRKILCF